MAMDYVDLPAELRNKRGETLRLRYTPNDVKAICRNLSRQGDRVNPSILARLITGGDPDAIEQCLLLGLAHDERSIHTVEIDRRTEQAVKDGMQLDALRLPILRAMESCGLADIAVFCEAVERVQAEGNREGNRGNAASSSPVTTSPTTSSSRPLSAVGSGS